MSRSKLTRIMIKGYMSIKECSVDLHNMNILIGPNGSGKSNFISSFSLIQRILSHDLQITVSRCGISTMLYNGMKTTRSISMEATFGENSYGFVLEPTNDQRMMFTEEYFKWNGVDNKSVLECGHFESVWEKGIGNVIDGHVVPVLDAKAWRVYHFHDTTRSSGMKQPHDLHDNAFLLQNAENIAPFLLRLKNEYPKAYSKIVNTVRMVAPLFDDFFLESNESNDTIVLRWKKRGYDGVMGPNQFSDGTLRFVCLSVLLLQPTKLMPETIILDEPELGLYPQAMVYLSEMLHSAGEKKQVIVSTQSADLVDDFSPEDIILVEDRGDGSIFRRVNANSLKEWLEDDYSLGLLWKKNLLSGDDR